MKALQIDHQRLADQAARQRVRERSRNIVRGRTARREAMKGYLAGLHSVSPKRIVLMDTVERLESGKGLYVVKHKNKKNETFYLK